MEEIWKDIKNYEGYYQVSNTGKVRSVDRLLTYSNGHRNNHKGRELKLRPNHRGYPMAMLSARDSQKCIAVHRLVAKAFIPNPENKETVNHISGEKEDNRVENLEWATWEENELHAKEKGLKPRGIDHANSKLTEEDVLKLREMYPYNNYTELGRIFGISHRTAWDIINRKTWKHL